MTKNFIYTQKTVDIDTLKLHPFFETVGSLMPTDQFVKDVAYFGYLELPVVTPEGLILTHSEDVLAAMALGDQTMDVVEINNANEDDIMRFIDFKSTVKHGKNRRAMYKTIEFLKDYLTKDNDGKAFAKRIEGNKTKEKIAKLLGVSATTVQNIMTIGNDIQALEDIDNGVKTSANVLSKTQDDDENKNDHKEDETENPEPPKEVDDAPKPKRKTKDKSKSKDKPKTDNGAPMPKGKVMWMTVCYDDGTEMIIENNGESYKMEMNNKVFDLSYSSREDHSALTGNNNIVIEHDFMPTNNESFHIGFSVRSQAA